jgi:hypothetical protein
MNEDIDIDNEKTGKNVRNDKNDELINEDVVPTSLFQSPIYFSAEQTHFKFLRLLNLMEPDRNVISMSKLMVWTTLVIMIYTLLNHYDNLIAMLAAIGSFLPVILHYAYRRKMQKADKDNH